MAITDLPALAALRTKMQRHQERQRVLAENVSNSDTPGFRPRDLVEPKFDPSGKPASGSAMGGLHMTLTSGNHMVQSGGVESFQFQSKMQFQTRPAGNAVNLEDEMLTASANQMDYAAAPSLYSKSLHLLKMAIGKA